MEVIFCDDRVVVCVKQPGVLSTDEPGGMPEKIRAYLSDPLATVKAVHRLDRVVGGVMVYARTARAAADLSKQISSGAFKKEYFAMVNGIPEESGTFTDFLYRNKEKRMTYVADELTEEARTAELRYSRISIHTDRSLVRVALLTGRTHQIRVQFSSRGFPLVGDKKYGRAEPCNIGLWSCGLRFLHPRTGEEMIFHVDPPQTEPWIS